MPITKSTYEGTWRLADIVGIAVGRESVAGKIKNPDGTPQIVTKYIAGAQLGGGEQVIEARAEIPRKVWRRVRKELAPYVIAEAVSAFTGTSKAADVGSPKLTDSD
jgi:hypothetical protein